MRTEEDRAFETLRVQWLRHDDLRRTGGSITELWTSREVLDHAREEAHRVLRAA